MWALCDVWFVVISMRDEKGGARGFWDWGGVGRGAGGGVWGGVGRLMFSRLLITSDLCRRGEKKREKERGREEGGGGGGGGLGRGREKTSIGGGRGGPCC